MRFYQVLISKHLSVTRRQIIVCVDTCLDTTTCDISHSVRTSLRTAPMRTCKCGVFLVTSLVTRALETVFSLDCWPLRVRVGVGGNGFRFEPVARPYRYFAGIDGELNVRFGKVLGVYRERRFREAIHHKFLSVRGRIFCCLARHLAVAKPWLHGRLSCLCFDISVLGG